MGPQHSLGHGSNYKPNGLVLFFFLLFLGRHNQQPTRPSPRRTLIFFFVFFSLFPVATHPKRTLFHTIFIHNLYIFLLASSHLVPKKQKRYMLHLFLLVYYPRNNPSKTPNSPLIDKAKTWHLSSSSLPCFTMTKKETLNTM